MKIIVFGATGSIGHLVVARLLEDGHCVTAFARNPGKLGINNPNLTLIAGNALDTANVNDAVDGQDAVIITLGSGILRGNAIRSQGTLNIIQAMHAHGVRRLICQSTLGAHESWSNLNFFWKRVMFGGLLRAAFRDHELQETIVRASGLDWTIVRPGAFVDGPATGTYKEDIQPDEHKLSLKITRADVVDFLNRQLAETGYLRRAVGISN
ncbi:MAG: SDR family oxidoreductase [Rhodospirillaceae bacterium]|nr:SDR family oxidoreductase [Rhodospirillaceae bacterium]